MVGKELYAAPPILRERNTAKDVGDRNCGDSGTALKHASQIEL